MTVGGLCDVPFHSMRACVLVRSLIDRSRPFGTLRGDAAECSGGVYDERWWLNELPRALSLPGNQIRSSSFLDQTPIDDIDPFCEVTVAKIISLSTRACARTHTHLSMYIHTYIYIYQSRLPRTYVLRFWSFPVSLWLECEHVSGCFSRRYRISDSI